MVSSSGPVQGGGLLSGRFFVRDRPAENLSMETGSALPAKQ